MSSAIKGLRPPPIDRPAIITQGYLGEEDHAINQEVFIFFRNITKEYCKHTPLNTYVDSADLSGRLISYNPPLICFLTPKQINTMLYNAPPLEKVNGYIQQQHRKGGIAKISADVPRSAEYPTLALAAHILDGGMTKEQVGSASLLYLGTEQFLKSPWIVQQNFTSPILIKEYYDFWRKANASLRTLSIFENALPIQHFFNLDSQTMRALLERMKSKHDSEHHYHVIEMLEISFGSLISPGHQKIIQLINRFKPVSARDSALGDSDHLFMVIPSFTLFQECINALYGENAIEGLVPMIGECTEAVREQYKKKDQCIVQLATKETSLVSVQEGIYFGPFGCVLRDFYYAERSCWLGHRGRRALCYIADHIFGSSEDTRTLVQKLLKGELWEQNQNFAHLFSIIPWTEKQKNAVLRNMMLLPDFWKQEFGIIPRELFPSEHTDCIMIALTIFPEERKAAEQALFEYYNKRAEKNRDTHFRLGALHYLGCGTAVSYSMAIKHWELCGTAQALCNCAIACEKDIRHPSQQQKIFHYTLAAADKGHKKAQFEAGEKYCSEKNYERALHYFERAAAQGHVHALYRLGMMHRDGLGTPVDLKRALEYLERASSLGLADAHYEIGLWYYEGMHIEKNFKSAHRYFENAAGKNHPGAYYKLFLLWKNARVNGHANFQRAYNYLKQSAALGYPLAISELRKTPPPLYIPPPPSSMSITALPAPIPSMQFPPPPPLPSPSMPVVNLPLDPSLIEQFGRGLKVDEPPKSVPKLKRKERSSSLSEGVKRLKL